MGKRSNTDKAIRNVIKWANRPAWSAQQDAVFDEHISPVCERIGLSQGELAEELEAHGYNGMLFGIMFEDFLSRRLPPDDRNVVDDYLKRRGWRESVPGRRYLQQLRDSVLSLYEVVDVSQGRHCDLRDLLREHEGKIIRVYEHMGTQNLVKWDQLAARVMKSNDRYVFSGGILPFSRETAQSLLRMLTDSRKIFDEEISQVTDNEALDEVLSSVNQQELFLQNSCPAFTTIWIMHALERLHQPLPEMVNRDGDALMFTETRFPFLAEQCDEIATLLDAAPELERDQADEYSWVWLPQPDAPGNQSGQGLAIDTLQGGQHLISGTVELKPGVLTFTANSLERAQRGQDMLESRLQGLIGPALSKLQSPEQLMAEAETGQHSDDTPEPVDGIDPVIAAEVIHNMLDQHYRQCLDEAIPVLENKTPRQCARHKKSREMVIEWLKHLENNELRRAADQGQAPYDSRWIWEELKLTRYRD